MELQVEGGRQLATSLVKEGLADQLVAFVAPVVLGGPQAALGDVGVRAIDEALRLSGVAWKPVGRDIMLEARFDRKGTHVEPEA